MTKHEKFMSLIESHDATSRGKDPEPGPTVQPSAAWLRHLQARYGKTPPLPHPAPVERTYQSLSESLETPPAELYTKLRRALRS